MLRETNEKLILLHCRKTDIELFVSGVNTAYGSKQNTSECPWCTMLHTILPFAHTAMSAKHQIKISWNVCMINRCKSISDWSNARRHRSADIKEQNPYPYSDNTSDQRCRTSTNAGPATFGNGFMWKKKVSSFELKKDIFLVDCMYDENLEE